MSAWPSTRARRVLAALLRLGWAVKRQSGSHRTLSRPGWADFVFAFHEDEEIGPRMLARIAKRTGYGQTICEQAVPANHTPERTRFARCSL
jgi:predicted RNA binding protein YcfA (HicA-like mRNA interferase family)